MNYYMSTVYHIIERDGYVQYASFIQIIPSKIGKCLTDFRVELCSIYTKNKPHYSHEYARETDFFMRLCMLHTCMYACIYTRIT